MLNFEVDDDLYRWITAKRYLFNTKLNRVTPDLFKLRPKEKALSTFWSKLITHEEVKNLSKFKSTGVASFKVKFLFDLNLKPIHEKNFESDHDSHVNIYGDFNDETCQKLAENTLIEISPEF